MGGGDLGWEIKILKLSGVKQVYDFWLRNVIFATTFFDDVTIFDVTITVKDVTISVKDVTISDEDVTICARDVTNSV